MPTDDGEKHPKAGGKKYRLSAAAKNDLDRIAHYTKKEFGVQQTEKYLVSLSNALERLNQNPRIAPPGPVSKTRQMSVGRHYIVYQVGSKQISVLRIIEQHRHLERHLYRKPKRERHRDEGFER